MFMPPADTLEQALSELKAREAQRRRDEAAAEQKPAEDFIVRFLRAFGDKAA